MFFFLDKEYCKPKEIEWKYAARKVKLKSIQQMTKHSAAKPMQLLQ